MVNFLSLMHRHLSEQSVIMHLSTRSKLFCTVKQLYCSTLHSVWSDLSIHNITSLMLLQRLSTVPLSIGPVTDWTLCLSDRSPIGHFVYRASHRSGHLSIGPVTDWTLCLSVWSPIVHFVFRTGHRLGTLSIRPVTDWMLSLSDRSPIGYFAYRAGHRLDTLSIGPITDWTLCQSGWSPIVHFVYQIGH